MNASLIKKQIELPFYHDVVCDDGVFSVFEDVFGDTNPVHQGENGILFGAAYAGFVSHIIGTEFLGAGAIIVSADYAFKDTVFRGEHLRAEIHSTSVVGGKHLKFDIKFIRTRRDRVSCVVKCLVDISATVFFKSSIAS